MSTVTNTPPKLSDDFRALLDRVGRNPAKVDGDDVKVGGAGASAPARCRSADEGPT